MKTTLSIIVIASLLANLVHAQQSDKEKVRSEMKAVLLSYGQAVEQMDVKKTSDHFSDDPEFIVFADGKNYNSEEMKALVRDQFYQGLKKCSITWDTISVKVLNSNQAVAYFKITQTLIDTNDQILKVTVESTFIGRKEGTNWKFIYGHANHKLVPNKALH